MTDLKHTMLTEEDFLEQSGIKGMKWGRRKDGQPGSSHVSADAARVKKIESRVKKHGTDNLSNDDLAKLNKRNQLMSEYKKNNPSKFKVGHEHVKTALQVVSTATAVVGVGLKVAKSPAVRSGAAAVAAALRGL